MIGLQNGILRYVLYGYVLLSESEGHPKIYF
jgi:hypothetical protein